MSDPKFPAGDEFPHYCLTAREYAAIHIAAAIAGRNVLFDDGNFAQRAVALADAVLKEAGDE